MRVFVCVRVSRYVSQREFGTQVDLYTYKFTYICKCVCVCSLAKTFSLTHTEKTHLSNGVCYTTNNATTQHRTDTINKPISINLANQAACSEQRHTLECQEGKDASLCASLSP